MRRVAEVRAGLMGAGEEQVPRGLKSARDDNNRALNGTPEGVPLQNSDPVTSVSQAAERIDISAGGAREMQVPFDKLRAGSRLVASILARDDNNKDIGSGAAAGVMLLLDTQGKQIPRSARDDNSERRIEAAGETARRTVPLPSILTSGAPTLMRAGVMPKPTPANLRRFAELPIAHKAINTIKDGWRGCGGGLQPRRGRGYVGRPDPALPPKEGGQRGTRHPEPRIPVPHISQKQGYVGHPMGYPMSVEERIAVLTENLEQPNPEDSFRSMIEQVLEDVLVGGFGAIELDLSGDAQRPLVLWPVDGASIRIRTDWDGNPTSPHYVQATGQFLPNAEIALADEELSYIRLNPRTHTPFGLGKLEVAFETIHEFLGAHRYAARLASNTVVQYALWLQNLTPQHHERLIRWWQDEIEGTGKVPILSAESKPEVLRFGAGTDADLRLQWQEFLIRIIADAFDLPPMVLGLERDVNRNTATTQSDDAFRTAVVPVARLIAEHLTRDVISKRLGWNDLEFVFTDVDAPNELEQAQIQQILVGCGVLTVNEVRRMRGLPPLAESTAGMADAPEMQ